MALSEESRDRCLKSKGQSTSGEATKALLRRSISSDELARLLQAVDAGQMALILDSCQPQVGRSLR